MLIKSWLTSHHIRIKVKHVNLLESSENKCFQNEWLRGVLQFLRSRQTGPLNVFWLALFIFLLYVFLQDDELCALVFEQFLNSDLKDSYEPPIRIPVAARRVILANNHVFQVLYFSVFYSTFQKFQVLSVVDISRSYYEQYRESLNLNDDLSWFHGHPDEHSVNKRFWRILHDIFQETHVEDHRKRIVHRNRMLRIGLGDGSVELFAYEYGGLGSITVDTPAGTKVGFGKINYVFLENNGFPKKIAVFLLTLTI